MEPTYITSKSKVTTIKMPFARSVIKLGNSYFISVPIDVIRKYGIEKGDLLLGDFDCFHSLVKTKAV